MDFFFFSGSYSGFLNKPRPAENPIKTRFGKKKKKKTRPDTLLHKRIRTGRVFWDGMGEVPAGRGFIAIPSSRSFVSCNIIN